MLWRGLPATFLEESGAWSGPWNKLHAHSWLELVQKQCSWFCRIRFSIADSLTQDRLGFQVRRFLAVKTSGNMVDELDFAEGILCVCLGEGVRD